MAKGKAQNPLKGGLYGLLAGAGASFLMDCYWKAVENVAGARPEQQPKAGGNEQQKDEPSTQIMADKVSEVTTGHEVPRKDKAAAGVGMHYATGSSFGLLFGVIASRKPGWGLAAGLLYGVAIWLALDEIGLRALHIGPPPEKVPWRQHFEALGAHLVYGAGIAILSRFLLDKL